jgi:pimeloyl-ACP methyl ester carboxylesterase
MREILVRAPDGRRIGVAEHGAENGTPVLWFPGTPGSRLSSLAPDDLLRAHAVRAITVERPGFGVSDPLPGRRVLDFPRDAACVADALGLGRFAIAGTSGAGPYLAACAFRLGARVTRVSAISCIGPLDAPRARRGMYPKRALTFTLLRRMPRAARAVVRAMKPERDPARFYAKMIADFPACDRAVLARIAEAQRAMTREAIRSADALADELILAASPWGFALEDVRVPYDLWHGARDVSTPIAMAKHVASAVPHARLFTFASEGHMLRFDHAREIVESLSR